MKRILTLLTAFLIPFGLCACGDSTQEASETETTLPPVTGFVVPSPMAKRPDYSVSENPTVQELRETAVRAMHDMLSIQ